jgi:hypothetical protein
MSSIGNPTIGRWAFAGCALLACLCGSEFFMLRNMRDATAAQMKSAEARIAILENKVAGIEHQLKSVKIVPLISSKPF